MARPDRCPFGDCLIHEAFLSGQYRIDGQILDPGENARGHPAGQCKYLLERFDLQIGLLRERHGRYQSLDHVRELGIIAPVRQVVLIQSSGELNIAKHIAWAGTEPNARNEAFNVSNDEVFRWEELWARIADYFAIPVAPYQITNPLAIRMANSGAAWDALVAQHALQPLPLSCLNSAWHTALDLGRPRECLHSMVKSHALGFRETQDTEQSFIDVFDRLRAERIIS